MWESMCHDSVMENVSESAPLQSVDRALHLALLLREGKQFSVQEAAAVLSTAPSTAHRLLNALTRRGFASQDRERRYVAGPVFAPEASRVNTGLLRRLAYPVLQELHEQLGETVQVMTLSGNNILFIDGIEDVERTLRVGMRVGDQMPAYCSAGGKAMLAEMSNPELERLYRGGLTPWPTARFTTLNALKRNLATVRRVGYGTSVEETERGVHGLGVGVHTPSGAIVAALTSAVPSVRFRRQDVPAYVAGLTEARDSLEEVLAAELPA
ncbi:IclR family transcriptional regulator [Saccharopolyspora shandongensis]|uniref:IclR family transcriptional regulator n=1 Tax=Saccharopolyspora shandongensis TaxID=418495 RepID=UPI0033D1E69B